MDPLSVILISIVALAGSPALILTGVLRRTALERRRALSLRRRDDGGFDGRFKHRITVAAIPRGRGIRLQAVVAAFPHAVELRAKRDGDGPGVEIGDPEFDGSVHSEGDELKLRAWLGVPARRQVRHAIASGACLREGRLELDLAGRPRAGRIRGFLIGLGEIALALDDPGDASRKLLENALRDPIPAVRQHCARLLVEHFPNVLVGESPELLAKDVPVSEDGRVDTLELLLSPKMPEELRLRALRRLLDRLSPEQARDRLRGLADPSSPVLCTAVIEQAERRRLGLPAEKLRELLAATDPMVVVAAADALASRGPDEASQAAMVAALARWRDPSILRELADALGAVGDARAVAALNAIPGGLMGDLGLRRAADRAVARIQARLPGAGAGQLSLDTRADAGWLALPAREGASIGAAMEGFFGETSVSAEHAAAIARGLYALSRVDGHDEREGMLIRSLWMDAVGWNTPLPLREMESAADVTPAELAKMLPTPELRKLFLKTAILLSWADSTVSPQEKAWIEKTAKEFGVENKELDRMDEQVRGWLLGQLSHISNVDAVKDVAKKLGF